MKNRATGRTTRLCDHYINTLFVDGTTGPIHDHYDTYESNEMLSQIIMRRMESEHKHVKIERIRKDGKVIISIKK